MAVSAVGRIGDYPVFAVVPVAATRRCIASPEFPIDRFPRKSGATAAGPIVVDADLAANKFLLNADLSTQNFNQVVVNIECLGRVVEQAFQGFLQLSKLHNFFCETPILAQVGAEQRSADN